MIEIHAGGGSASPEERSAVDAILGPPSSGWDGGVRTDLDGHVAFGGYAAAREQRHMLLPALHALQERMGYVSREGLDYVCIRLGVPPAEAFGVASAYAMFSTAPLQASVLHVCDDVGCRASTSDDPCARVEVALGPEGSATGSLMWTRSACLGRCERGSAALLQVAGDRPCRIELAPLDGSALDALLTGCNDRRSEEKRGESGPASAGGRSDLGSASRKVS